MWYILSIGEAGIITALRLLYHRRKAPLWYILSIGEAGIIAALRLLYHDCKAEGSNFAEKLPNMQSLSWFNVLSGAGSFASACAVRLLYHILRGTNTVHLQQTDVEIPENFSKKAPVNNRRFSLWSGRRGSNSLPPPWQGGALPDELHPHRNRECYYTTQFLRLSSGFYKFSDFSRGRFSFPSSIPY